MMQLNHRKQSIKDSGLNFKNPFGFPIVSQTEIFSNKICVICQHSSYFPSSHAPNLNNHLNFTSSYLIFTKYLILMSFVHPSQFSNILLNVSLLQDSISTWIFHLPFPPLPFSFPFASLLLSIHTHSLNYDLKYHLHSYNFQFKSPTSCLNSGFIYPTAHLTSLEYQQAPQILHI